MNIGSFEEFWKKDRLAHEENCFSKDAPCVALGIRMSDECVFAELNEEGNPWGTLEPERRKELNRRYNDIAEKTVGIRLLREKFDPPDMAFPPLRRIGEVFGSEYVFNGTEWLTQSCNNEKELEAMLDKVDRTDIREFIVPENFEREKKRIYEQYGVKPPVWRGMRGPVTLAMSVYGCENLIFLIMDEPELAKRFSDTLLRVIKAYIDISSEEAGYNRENRPHGFYFYDDNCSMLNLEMYEFFAYPVLRGVFDYISPDAGDVRYQHSDSDMAHILPSLSKLNLNGCNFGPSLTVEEIRAHLPRARIDGQLSPMTFMSNDREKIIAEVKRDCLAAKKTGGGVQLSTAGSINNGSLLSSMKLVMETIEEYGQYSD